MERKVFNVTEVAEILQTSPKRIRDLINYGHLKAFRLGRILVRNSDLDDFLLSAVGKDYTDGRPVELEIKE